MCSCGVVLFEVELSVKYQAYVCMNVFGLVVSLSREYRPTRHLNADILVLGGGWLAGYWLKLEPEMANLLKCSIVVSVTHSHYQPKPAGHCNKHFVHIDTRTL